MYVCTLHDIGPQQSCRLEGAWESSGEEIFLDLQVELVACQLLVKFGRVIHIKLDFEVDVDGIGTCRLGKTNEIQLKVNHPGSQSRQAFICCLRSG